jgi:CheY-like chemotaxis protein
VLFSALLIDTYPDTRGLNILAVDDEAGSRTALDVVLKLAGHHTDFAKDGDEALELFEHADIPYDMIITDHLMVRVSGLDLVRRLREKGFKGEIVVLTAYAGTIDEEEYKKMEVVGLMEKPFEIAELRQWIDCIHKHHEEIEEHRDCPPKAIDFWWLRHNLEE